MFLLLNDIFLVPTNGADQPYSNIRGVDNANIEFLQRQTSMQTDAIYQVESDSGRSWFQHQFSLYCILGINVEMNSP